MTDPEFDVAIVGNGPVGQLLAGLLGAQKFRVGVFERWPTVYPLPRACAVDDEGMRILQADGVAADFEKVAVNVGGEYVWVNAVGEELLSLKRPAAGTSGWGARYMMYQPDLETLLDRKAASHPTVIVRRGWAAIGLRQDAQGADLQVQEGEVDSAGQWRARSEPRWVRAHFIVGADGANSFIRGAADLGWIDLGFRADWIVIDFRPHDPNAYIDMPLAGQICDPARPVSLFRRLGHFHARWEMMLLPGETAEEITQIDRVWELLSRWVTPADGEIVRRAVYTFRSGVAERWHRDRVMIAGDAAHVMPPFLGQGMCSGMRDAMAVSWRLSGVLRGQLDSQVLDTYSLERRQHVEDVIARAVAMGRIVCITDPEAAAQRDADYRSGKAPMLPPFPRLRAGLLHPDSQRSSLVGEVCLQALVRVDGSVGRFDDVVARGWLVLSTTGHPDTVLDDAQRAYLDAIGARCVLISRDPDAGVFDIDGQYAEYFRSQQIAALIVRPDFYIFGSVESLESLPTLLQALIDQLPLAHGVKRNLTMQRHQE